MPEQDSIVCHRCGALMDEGGPLFYHVKIEAYPLPIVPPLTLEDLERNFDEELARLIEEARGMSEQELMDQVYRRLLLHLCPSCYLRWIENPTG
jgi:hypothetical protein